MLKSEIKLGVEYALREKRSAAEPLQRVRILEHVTGNKWKAEWIDPNPGLVHYLESSHLVVAWKDHRAFLKEEADEARLLSDNSQVGYVKDSPVTRALEQVYEAVGDDVGFSDEGVERRSRDHRAAPHAGSDYHHHH